MCPECREPLIVFELDGVEIDSSFYRPHRRQTYERWAESTPATFAFSVKLPKAITHERRLMRAMGDRRRMMMRRRSRRRAGRGAGREQRQGRKAQGGKASPEPPDRPQASAASTRARIQFGS